MCIGAEQQVSYFVRDSGTDKRRHVGSRFAREPGHAIRVNRGERSGTGRRVNQGVPQLQLAASRGGSWKLHEPYGEL